MLNLQGRVPTSGGAAFTKHYPPTLDRVGITHRPDFFLPHVQPTLAALATAEPKQSSQQRIGNFNLHTEKRGTAIPRLYLFFYQFKLKIALLIHEAWKKNSNPMELVSRWKTAGIGYAGAAERS